LFILLIVKIIEKSFGIVKTIQYLCGMKNIVTKEMIGLLFKPKDGDKSMPLESFFEHYELYTQKFDNTKWIS